MTLSFYYVTLFLLLNILIWSQNVHGHACKPDWFGSNCQYKCHCKFTACDDDGMCRDGVCEKGWFGPGCQYVDIVQTHVTDHIPFWLHDDNDYSCNNDQTLVSLTVTLTSEFPFTWLRLQVQDPSLLLAFQVSFSNKGNQSIFMCKNMRTAKVNERTMDVHCDMRVLVQHVILTGEGVKSLCSLYISGGRNVALRQNTNQSSTKVRLFAAENAVDGNIDRELNHESCSVIDDGVKNPTWNVTFQREMTINRYVIYNYSNNNLTGFTITSFSKNFLIIMTHTDTDTTPRDVYMLETPLDTSPIFLVNIQARKTNTSNFVLCEVELYGDSLCPHSKYGRECQYTCNCAVKNEACFVSTGGCQSGCSAGFQGENCNQPCDLDKYGEGCNYNCSQFCVMSDSYYTSCDHIEGICLHGCQSGYDGPKCDQVKLRDHAFNIATLGGIVAALAILVIVTVCCVVLCRKHYSYTTEKRMYYHSKNEAIYEIPSPT